MSVVEGLRKRSPIEHVAKLMNTLPGNAKVHVVDRDATEQYTVFISNGAIQVFDMQGLPQTVNVLNTGAAYLSTLTPNTSIKMTTIADYTFVVNREKVTAMLPALTPNRGFEALVHVRQGNYAQDYQVLINGVVQATYTTSATDKNTIKTNAIATQLSTQLTANLGAGWTITLSGNTLHIKMVAGTDFTISTLDSFGGQALLAVKGSVQNFSDLPTIAPDGFVIEVAGDANTQFDNYFVKFKSNAVGLFDKGVWEETVKQGVPFQLDPATMPHTLIRNADGTFTFDQAVWGDRAVGDEASAQTPSFVGNTIANIVFFKDRLGFLSGSNLSFSEAGFYFNHFPTTVTTLLDSDRIDVQSPNPRVTNFFSAEAFNEQLLLFSDKAQFIIPGDVPLTPSTIVINQTTAVLASTTADPVGIGNNVYFAVPRGGFSGVHEFYVASNIMNTNGTSDITAHVPKFIHGNITEIAAATNADMLIFLQDSEPNTFYPYKFYWSGQEKLQSSWSEWAVDPTGTILSASFINTTLYLVIQYADGVYLERMRVEDGVVDAWTDLHDPAGLGYSTHLDRRITEARCTSVVYDPITNQTTFTLPYNCTGTMNIVTRALDPATNPTNVPGVLVPVVTQGVNTLVVNGDYSLTPVWVGQTYTMRYDFSKQVMKEQALGGGQATTNAGRLQLRTMQLSHTRSGYFRCEVTPEFRTPNVYTFTGKVLGAGWSLVGQVNLGTGDFRFPLMSRNDRVSMSIVNDSYLPCSFQSAEWEAQYHIRSKRA